MSFAAPGRHTRPQPRLAAFEKASTFAHSFPTWWSGKAKLSAEWLEPLFGSLASGGTAPNGPHFGINRSPALRSASYRTLPVRYGLLKQEILIVLVLADATKGPTGKKPAITAAKVEGSARRSHTRPNLVPILPFNPNPPAALPKGGLQIGGGFAFWPP